MDQLTQAVGAVTNPQQTDWEAAMRTFCSALWGGTAWGSSGTATSGDRPPTQVRARPGSHGQ
ncbi:hypothetical protein NKH18_38240 [Streptomyces sp. M10(2022)]